MRLDASSTAAVVEQHPVDALRGRLEFRAALAGQRELMAVEFRAHPPRMRRQQQDAAADHQRLLDRMGDEQQREGRVVPQRSSSSCMRRRVSASSAANGSSISSTFGRMASARAIATRCFMPPDSVCG
jgi:hypothetical protein